MLHGSVSTFPATVSILRPIKPRSRAPKPTHHGHTNDNLVADERQLCAASAAAACASRISCAWRRQSLPNHLLLVKLAGAYPLFLCGSPLRCPGARLRRRLSRWGCRPRPRASQKSGGAARRCYMSPLGLKAQKNSSHLYSMVQKNNSFVGYGPAKTILFLFSFVGLSFFVRREKQVSHTGGAGSLAAPLAHALPGQRHGCVVGAAPFFFPSACGGKKKWGGSCVVFFFCGFVSLLWLRFGFVRGRFVGRSVLSGSPVSGAGVRCGGRAASSCRGGVGGRAVGFGVSGSGRVRCSVGGAAAGAGAVVGSGAGGGCVVAFGSAGSLSVLGARGVGRAGGRPAPLFFAPRAVTKRKSAKT